MKVEDFSPYHVFIDRRQLDINASDLKTATLIYRNHKEFLTTTDISLSGDELDCEEKEEENREEKSKPMIWFTGCIYIFRKCRDSGSISTSDRPICGSIIIHQCN